MNEVVMMRIAFLAMTIFTTVVGVKLYRQAPPERRTARLIFVIIAMAIGISLISLSFLWL